jgi:hypothetical protein
MSDNYRLIVMTCDAYLPAIRVFAYLTNKYWRPNPRVIVSGFSVPSFRLPDNYSFFSAGEQSKFPFKKWSDALYITLQEYTDEVFILMLEDYWLTRPVNEEAVSALVEYARAHKDVLKIDLGADRLYAHGTDLNYGTYGYLDLVRSDPQSAYHFSLMPGIWRRDNLLSMMIPDESPHDMEMDGTTRLSMTDHLVLGTRQWPLKITLGLRACDPHNVMLNEMSDHDQAELRGLGLLRPWNIS